MCKKLLSFLAFVFLLSSSTALAQSKTVSGTVTDASGAPLPGVSVVEKGTANGAAADFDGNYSISVSGDGAILVFSSLGFTTKEVSVSGKSTINVSLEEDASQLDEVVVTALGIKREKKSLGYAIQEVKGVEMIQARENNIANAFTGKISGLQVIRGSNGPSSSSKIILRGSSSLTGDNQPLIVVDGIPINNFTGGENESFWNPTADLGNGLSDIDPETIESVSVLKGASAAALYGSRAGNGVILITTKTGSQQEGLGVSYSITTGFETLFMTPDLQNQFGQGDRGIYNELSSTSWGPKITGQSVTDWKGDTVALQAHDNIDSFYDTGVSITQSLTFQQQVSDATSIFTSISHLRDDSKIPGATLERLNISNRAVSVFGKNKNWTTDFKANYILTTANNRPIGGVNASNGTSTILGLPRSLNVNDLRNSRDASGAMIWYNPDSSTINPFWSAQYNQASDSRDRFLIFGSLKNEINDWLTAQVKIGADMYTSNTETKRFAGSPIAPTGRYSLGKSTFLETNYSALLTAAKDNIFGKFGGSATLGGNLMYTKNTSLNSSSGELEVPDLFSLNNGINNPTVNQGFTQQKINSVYGTLQINYDGYWFLDITGRNDWSTTLSEENRSFFYPSVSTSLVVTDMIRKNDGNVPAWLTYAKIRGSYAQVGNSLNPYELLNTYEIGKDPNGNTTASRRDVLYNPDLKNELIKSLEFGFETRLFNVVHMDLSWYKTNATNQLINLALNPQSGYTARKINAGDIQNSGFEISLNAKILGNEDSFNWDLGVNFSKNVNKIISLHEDVKEYPLGSYEDVRIRSDEGGGYGDIYGSVYRRVTDEGSEHFGKLILTDLGSPQEATEPELLGNQQADGLLGVTNSFAYKGFNFSFLIDARLGGEMFSGTNYSLQQSGAAAETVVNGEREDFVVEGVIDVTPDGAETSVYEINTVMVSHQDYWAAIGAGNLGITEANIYDATTIRIRNIQLNYSFSKETLKNTFLKSANLGFSVNNVLMLDSNLNGVDPEAVYGTRTNATGYESFSTPTSRTYFLNLSVRF